MTRSLVLSLYRIFGPAALTLFIAGLLNDAGLISFDKEPLYTIWVAAVFGAVFATPLAAAASIPVIIIFRREPAILIPALCLFLFCAIMIFAALIVNQPNEGLMQLSLAGLFGFGLTATWFGWREAR